MHELVFKNDKALMMYVKREGAGVPWHSFGEGYDSPPDLEEVKRVCGFDRTITVHDVESNGIRLPDCRGVFDSENRYLGTVGPDYEVLQDSDMIDSLLPWIESGLAEVETAGLLRGGSRAWAQLRLKDSTVEIAPGDAIRTHLLVAQGHDMSLGLMSGRSQERVVCANTLRVALSEGGFIRRKHRGNIKQASVDVQAKLLEWAKEDQKVIEAFRFLASKSVDSKGVAAFIQAVTGKSAEDGTRNGPGDRIKLHFLSGIGNKGETWWHLLNAVTQDVTHGLGNKMTDDAPGDREGRTLNKMFFGTGAKLNSDAFRIAVNLASDKPANAKLSLAA